jgi:hypothetical protein
MPLWSWARPRPILILTHRLLRPSAVVRKLECRKMHAREKSSRMCGQVEFWRWLALAAGVSRSYKQKKPRWSSHARLLGTALELSSSASFQFSIYYLLPFSSMIWSLCLPFISLLISPKSYMCRPASKSSYLESFLPTKRCRSCVVQHIAEP